MRDENHCCRRLTPARLGAFEPVRQRGAGACGTVDCCREREGQTHSLKAPTDGTSCPADQGATPPQLTTEPALPAGREAGPFLRARHRRSKPGDSQASRVITRRSELTARHAGRSPPAACPEQKCSGGRRRRLPPIGQRRCRRATVAFPAPRHQRGPARRRLAGHRLRSTRSSASSRMQGSHGSTPPTDPETRKFRERVRSRRAGRTRLARRLFRKPPKSTTPRMVGEIPELGPE
jgi:hypothetical protein